MYLKPQKEEWENEVEAILKKSHPRTSQIWQTTSMCIFKNLANPKMGKYKANNTEAHDNQTTETKGRKRVMWRDRYGMEVHLVGTIKSKSRMSWGQW